MGLVARQRSGAQGCLQRLAPWVVVAVFVGVGYWSLLPPGPVSAAAPDDQFSAARAFDHVRVIATEPHPMGTAAIARVRRYIVTELEKLGVSIDLQTFTAPGFYGRGESVRLTNIVGRIPGTATTKAVGLMGHYDTVPTTPGANDNTAAVATVLETARALLTGPSLRNDVYLIFTDGEEPAPRHGANAFVNRHPAFANIGLVVNFEASGGTGASMLAETSGPDGWLVHELAAADARPAAFSFLTGTSRLLGDIGTDFDAFRNAGVPGLHFVYLHGSPIYHTEADNIDAVSRGSLQHHGEHALAVARHFGALDLNAPRPAGDVVYFAVRPLFVQYPAAWATPLALLALAVGVFGLWRWKGSTGVTAPAPILRFFRTLGGGLLGAIAGTILWLLITTMRSMPGVIESCFYLLCALALAAWVASRISPDRTYPRRLEVVPIWLALALLTAVWLPGFSYLFAWPALAAAVALCWRSGGGALRTLRFALVAAPTLILMTPAVDFFLQMAQPRPGNPGSEMKAAVALPLLLALGVAGLLRTQWPRQTVSGCDNG